MDLTREYDMLESKIQNVTSIKTYVAIPIVYVAINMRIILYAVICPLSSYW
jgi:hypothetical protein